MTRLHGSQPVSLAVIPRFLLLAPGTLMLVSTLFSLIGISVLAGFAGPDLIGTRSSSRAARSALPAWAGMNAVTGGQAEVNDGAFAAYREALDIVKREYYGEPITRPRENELTVAAIRGMIYGLNDHYSSYMKPAEWQAMQLMNRGDFDSIGAEIEATGAAARVSRVYSDTPASRSGLRVDDVITRVGLTAAPGSAIRWIPTRGLAQQALARIVTGRPGSRVSLGVWRKGVPKEMLFQIVVSHVEPMIVRYWMEDRENKIGHILLTEFNEKSDEQLDRAWTALEKQGMRALVLDLRYNPGGLLDVAVDIGSRFIESGPVVIIQEKNGQPQRKIARSTLQTHRRLPLAVLINENSASAAEIVAGAIKDHGTGVLVGKHTFGKGMVQTLFPLDDNSALKLTTARYFTSRGHDINNRLDEDRRPIFGTGGIKPDFEVAQPVAWQDQNFDDKANDAQLQKALDVLREKLGVVARK